MTSSFFRPSLPRSVAVTLAALLASVVLGGCAGPQALRVSYVQYAESFARASNEQLLLNLARLLNDHPPHFLQMGGMSAQFVFSGGLTGNYSVREGFNPSDWGIALGASESPVFNFTPLSGSAYSQVLLTPFDSKLLYSYVNQNFPVSLIIRLMVAQITLVYPNGTRASFRNRFNVEEPNNYGDFLRLAALLNRLNDDDLLGVKVGDETGDVSFSLTGTARSEIRRLMAADPRYKLVTFNAATGGRGTARVKIKTRSFMSVMLSAPYEPRVFDRLSSDFLAGLPESEREPVLRIEYDPAFVSPRSAEVKYAGKRYVVADKPGSSRNRITFTILQLLSSQTQLDPSQLPTQQLIQVR